MLESGLVCEEDSASVVSGSGLVLVSVDEGSASVVWDTGLVVESVEKNM